MTRNRQRGMTMWSAAFVIGVSVFFLFLFFKLLPPYLEDLKVSTALNGLATESGAGAMSKAELLSRLEKRFDIDNVTNVKSNQLAIETRGKVKVMRLSYEVVVPLVYNVSALLEFDHVSQVSVTE
ncbi:MAG TPA: DUF4845 domain-containing protein [Burkholderiales bacterium]|jgi:hypothetical protein